MQLSKKIFFTLLLFTATLHAFSQHISSELFNSNWKFKKGELKTPYAHNLDDSDWRLINLPHDWAIEEPTLIDGDGNTGKLNWKGEAWYRNSFYVPENISESNFFILFDGVMAFPQVYINGQFAGRWDYGYNSFYLDISDFVSPGTNNTIAVHVDTRKHESRWYPGAGIYRKVSILQLNKLHTEIWGTYITTPFVSDDSAVVNIQTNIRNDYNSNRNFKLQHRVFLNNKLVTQTKAEYYIENNSNLTSSIDLIIKGPNLWDIDTPVLYKVETSIILSDSIIDSYITRFGIRTINFTSDDGFYLNDRRVQLKGVNLHHDLGPLGAAFNYRAMQRQLEIMKDMGCNAIRTSHNTAAPEMLDLCDEMGLLFFNEAFDKYDAKIDIVDTTNFEDYSYRNIRNHVVRDRNHPSLFIWSVGNEIGDVQWDIDGGFNKLQTMINNVLKFDTTRFITLVCDSKESAKLRHFDFYDVHSWNYGRRYSLARELEPSKAVIISESASTLSSRGFYEFPLPENKTDFTTSLQVSSYDLNAPWWAEVADDDFMWQQQEPYVAGEFVWTGFDYLGEPTPYNNEWVKENGLSDSAASRSSYFGIVDIVGLPKDRYYLYKSYWKPDDTTIHILPHWNWPSHIGETVPVFVYTNGDSAELFINDVSQGVRRKKHDSDESTERFRLMWKNTIYQKGNIRALVWKDGDIMGEELVYTTGKPVSIELIADRDTIAADGNDISYIRVETVDINGHYVPTANNEITIAIKGAGEIAGVGNGNPQSMDPFYSNTIDLFNGKAMVIIRSGTQQGVIDLKASSEGLTGSKISIYSK